VHAEGEGKMLVSTRDGVVTLSVAQQPSGEIVRNPKPLMFLHPDPSLRIAALEAMVEEIGPSHPDTCVWRKRLADQALSDTEMGAYLEALAASPPVVLNHLTASLQAELITDPALLVPRDLRYYEHLCGNAPNDIGKQNFVSDVLLPHFRALLSHDLEEGLLLTLPAGIHADVMIQPLVEQVPNDDLWSAIEAIGDPIDPVSLLNLWDLCLARAATDDRFRDRASELMDRLLADQFLRPDGADLYAFFPVLLDLVQTQLYVTPSMAGQPDYWRRLCAWTHCGHLIRLLDGWEIDPEKWHAWARRVAHPSQRIVPFLERIEFPLSRGVTFPQLETSSFVAGQVFSLLQGHTEENRTSINVDTRIHRYMEVLQASGRSLDVLLAGPLELDVEPVNITGRETLFVDQKEFFEEKLEALGTDLNDPMWHHLAYLAQVVPIPDSILQGIAESLSNKILPEDDDGNTKSIEVLEPIAFLAAVTRHGALAEAVLNRCVKESLAGAITENDVSSLLLVGLTACGYLRSKKDAVIRFSAYLRDLAAIVPGKEQLAEVLAFIDMLKMLLPVDLWMFSEAEALVSAA